MDIVRRVQDILLKPGDTWPAIAAEPADAGSIYKQYLLLIAAIPPLAALIGITLIGVGGFGFRVRMPLLYGLEAAIVQYALTLVMIFVVALVVEALAPNFGGTKDRVAALKVVAYGSTAALVGGVFNLIPALGILALLAALYSIYLFYLGLPVLMKCPQDKAVAYTVVVAVLALVASLIVGAIAAAVMPGMRHGMWGAAGSGAPVSINTPDGQVTIDTARVEDMAKRMEAAAKRAQANARTADTTPAVAVADTKTQELAPLQPEQLKALLPEALSDLKRESVESFGAGPAGVSVASAKYRNAARSIDLSITDVGGPMGAAVAMWASMTVDRETADEVEKVYHDGNRSVHEKYRKDGSGAELQLVLPNGTMVGATGEQVDMAALKAAVAGVDTAKLQALPRATVQR